MGTLRFFEEVVSFKIRRTFGFADYRKMTLHLAGGIFFAIFVKDRRRFGNLSVQIRAIALGFHYFWSRQHGGPA